MIERDRVWMGGGRRVAPGCDRKGENKGRNAQHAVHERLPGTRFRAAVDAGRVPAYFCRDRKSRRRIILPNSAPQQELPPPNGLRKAKGALGERQLRTWIQQSLSVNSESDGGGAVCGLFDWSIKMGARMSISFWQADRNWFIQQRISTLSEQGASAPAVPAVDRSSTAARKSEDEAALAGNGELRSAAVNALELSSSSGYTTSLATPGSLLDRSA